jgi:hypothetical protein
LEEGVMHVLVTGGRFYKNSGLVYKALREVKKLYGRSIIITHGGAPGADKFANDWALEAQVPCFRFPARWGEHANAAGPIRNREMRDFMLLTRDQLHWQWIVLAFPSANSVGTIDMMKIADKEGFKVFDVEDLTKNGDDFKIEGSQEEKG